MGEERFQAIVAAVAIAAVGLVGIAFVGGTAWMHAEDARRDRAAIEAGLVERVLPDGRIVWTKPEGTTSATR